MRSRRCGDEMRSGLLYAASVSARFFPTGRASFAALILSVLIIGFLVFSSFRRAAQDCVRMTESVSICAASDMAKLPNHGPVPLEAESFNLQRRGIELRAARNETIAFQLILVGVKEQAELVTVAAKDLEGPGGARLHAGKNIQLFFAHYVRTDPAGYTWGPPSDVLPWPDFYPDALVPFQAACGERRVLVEAVTVPPANGTNQAVWVDIYVPGDRPPGEYSGTIDLAASGGRLAVPVSLIVEPVALPERPSIDAVGELYAPYVQEGVGSDPGSPGWQAMAHCYQRLAHQHRMVFIERTHRFVGPIPGDAARETETWADYDRAFGPALSGELFSAAAGYVGPGADTPVAVWRTPWPQPYNGRLDEPLPEEEITRYENVARAWSAHAESEGWNDTRFFAYIFDEVDGPGRRDADGNDETAAATALAHEQMRRVQAALDRGSPAYPIDLLWTSHSNPVQWAGQSGLDLVGIIRLWAPAAEAAPPGFLRERVAAGERAWFYHSGHPYVGVHAINATGIDMRTWGLIAARYELSGQLMWAVNLGDRDDPFDKPSYHPDDDRFGNGTMVYPGNMLDRIGFEPAPGPVPSMRLKAWRRGLQDAELVRLARGNGRGEEVDLLLREYFPAALADAQGGAAWPRDPAAWHRFRQRLLTLAAP